MFVLNDKRLQDLRESRMRPILEKAKLRRCECGGQMVATDIEHSFKYSSTAPGGYRLFYCCQKCKHAAVFMSPLLLAQVLFGLLLSGGGLFLLGRFVCSRKPTYEGGVQLPPPRLQDLLWILMGSLLVFCLFAFLARGIFTEARNRKRYRPIGP
jgi:hypothetical protein